MYGHVVCHGLITGVKNTASRLQQDEDAKETALCNRTHSEWDSVYNDKAVPVMDGRLVSASRKIQCVSLTTSLVISSIFFAFIIP